MFSAARAGRNFPQSLHRSSPLSRGFLESGTGGVLLYVAPIWELLPLRFGSAYGVVVYQPTQDAEGRGLQSPQ